MEQQIMEELQRINKTFDEIIEMIHNCPTCSILNNRLTRQEVAKRLRISLGTLDKRIRDGELTTIQEGKRIFITRQELDRYIRESA